MRDEEVFVKLLALLATSPNAFRAEVRRMRDRDPALLERFSEKLRHEIADATMAEDKAHARAKYLRRQSGMLRAIVGAPRKPTD